MKLPAFITDMRLLYKEREKEEKVDVGNLPVNVLVSPRPLLHVYWYHCGVANLPLAQKLTKTSQEVLCHETTGYWQC